MTIFISTKEVEEKNCIKKETVESTEIVKTNYSKGEKKKKKEKW